MIDLFQAVVTPPPCATTASFADWIKTCTAIAALPLAAFTFYLGFRQKEKERSKDYYHKNVVDFVLPPALLFFSTEIPNLQQAGKAAIAGMRSAAAELPRESVAALTRFSTGLFDLQDIITARTAVFDQAATNKIQTRFEDLQDAVSTWFDEVGMHKRRNPEELANIVMDGQRSIVKHIFEGRIDDFRRA